MKQGVLGMQSWMMKVR